MIPKIIHQIYEDMSGPPKKLKEMSKSWIKHHPDWEYQFWNKNDIENFILDKYPYFTDIYNKFPYNVQRWDTIRYLILYEVGGLYVDFDYECKKNIEPLLTNECIMGLEPQSHANIHKMSYIVGNAFMATIPNHPYFKEIINNIFIYPKRYKKTYPKWKYILETTGPFLTTNVYNNTIYKKNIELLSPDLISPLSIEDINMISNRRYRYHIQKKTKKAFAIHYFSGSWHCQLN